MSGEHGRILVVDDNRMNRLKLSLSLEQQGHTVVVAEDGQQALDAIKSQPPDVVLLDIVMPEMDGFQVLERVKADPDMRDIPVIVISALDEMDSAVRCIEIGAEDYLPKPFNPVLLRARLNASLQKKRLRDLEKAYLQQEVMLRQSEKLATLGKLSAGMAHELNNPAAAAKRAAVQLQTTFSRMQQTHMNLCRAGPLFQAVGLTGGTGGAGAGEGEAAGEHRPASSWRPGKVRSRPGWGIGGSGIAGRWHPPWSAWVTSPANWRRWPSRSPLPSSPRWSSGCTAPR